MYTSIILVIVLFFGLNVFKSRKQPVTKELPKAVFLRIYVLLYFSWFVLGGIFAFIEYQLNKSLLKSSQDYVFNLYPDNTFWIGISVVFGFSVSLVLCFAFIEIILKEKAQSFWVNYNKVYPFNAKILLKILLFLLTISGIAISQLAHRSFFRTYKEKIEMSRLFEWEKHEFTMDDIMELNHFQTLIAPNGKRIHKPHYEIIFKDSTIWKTTFDIREPSQNDDRYFEFISKQSGIAIQSKN